MQNKPIETLLEAWLTFLSEDDPHRLGELFEAFPDFIAMYDEIKYLEEVSSEVHRLKANPS